MDRVDRHRYFDSLHAGDPEQKIINDAAEALEAATEFRRSRRSSSREKAPTATWGKHDAGGEVTDVQRERLAGQSTWRGTRAWNRLAHRASSISGPGAAEIGAGHRR